MIFVAVGTQIPFDRMVKAIDRWAGQRGRNDVFAQIGQTDWQPAHIGFAKFITPQEFKAKAQAADLIVAHAGMGSILTALELGKPILVMPRRFDLQEHRNDHQLATAKRLLELKKVAVAFDEAELIVRLDQSGSLDSGQKIGPHASEQLIATLRDFING